MKPHKTATSSTGLLAYLTGIGRAIFHHQDHDAQQASDQYWAVMHIDTNGVLQNTTVRVISVHPGLRSVTVRREADEQDIILRISRIVEAIDIRSGRRVDLAKWLDSHPPMGLGGGTQS
ncbi:hypothetical protein [Aquabacterium sp.]|uniref:hypothetical protein n=1 Tax=Aquabacterium sp. TaxID=1872578 RepID=UPI0019A10A6D|nr:hypothetical protein [Aquabacterium sp.]MBC7699477.1 hypothetical protein [Aquabacterium sp.]